MSDTCEKKYFPYEFYEAEEEDDKYKEFAKRHICVGPKRYCFPRTYKELAHVYYNFEVRPDDVWIVGYPRSGTTMSEELVWLLCNNLDYEEAVERVMADRVVYFELSATTGDDTMAKAIEWTKLRNKSVDFRTLKGIPNHEKLAKRKERRFIKTHLPFSLLPPNLISSGCKIIYIARKPQDVFVSFYHCDEMLKPTGTGFTLQEYCELFMKGHVRFTPILEHVNEGWERRHNNNMMFVFYEELNKNLRETIKKYANFLEKELSEEEVDKLVDHFQIDNFRNNKSVNNEYLRELGLTNKNKEHDFIRKGKVDGWKECFDDVTKKRLQKWVEDGLRDTDLKYPEV